MSLRLFQTWFQDTCHRMFHKSQDIFHGLSRHDFRTGAGDCFRYPIITYTMDYFKNLTRCSMVFSRNLKTRSVGCSRHDLRTCRWTRRLRWWDGVSQVWWGRIFRFSPRRRGRPWRPSSCRGAPRNARDSARWSLHRTPAAPCHCNQNITNQEILSFKFNFSPNLCKLPLIHRWKLLNV